MASRDFTLSATFDDRSDAERAMQDLAASGFSLDQFELESAAIGRGGLMVHVLKVKAGGHEAEAEKILSRHGPREQRAPIGTPERPLAIPEADRWEQELPSSGQAPSLEPGLLAGHVPEADYQEQQLEAERVPVVEEESVSSFKIEYGSEADQIEQAMAPDRTAISDEEEEELRERR